MLASQSVTNPLTNIIDIPDIKKKSESQAEREKEQRSPLRKEHALFKP